MVPWGWGSAQISDYNDLYSVSKVGTDALKSVYGTKYSIGSPANLLCMMKLMFQKFRS